MNFNIKYIILGAIIVTMLIAFGRNPIKEGRQERAAEKKAHGDPLVYSIQQHNEKNGHFGANMLPNGMGMAHQAVGRPPHNNMHTQQSASPSTLTVPNIGADQPNNYYPPPPLQNSQ